MNMFEFVYLRLRNFYNQTANLYVNLVLDRPYKFVLSYLLVAALFSVGLFQVKLNLDTDALALVRNSESVKHAMLLNKTFTTNQNERHFNNKLLDLGYYFEMIINVKQPNTSKRPSNDALFLPEYNFINATILEEYNRLFDAVESLQIEEEEANGDSKKIYSYKDLCAKRLKKCSVEGGLMRRSSFQSRLLSHSVGYPADDNKNTYVDSTEMDGLTINVIFGIYRHEILIDNEPGSTQGAKKVPIHTGTIRNRFDLLYNTERNRYLAVKYMKKFVSFMGQVKENDTYPHLNMSYFTSHSLTDEIEKYSKSDTNFVLVSFMFFWLSMLVTFSVGMPVGQEESVAARIRANLSASSSSSTIKTYLARKYNRFNLDFVLTNGAWYLTFVVFVQIVLTFTASFGVLSLLGVRVNFLTATIVFILLIISCNQAYLLYVNVTMWNESSKIGGDGGGGIGGIGGLEENGSSSNNHDENNLNECDVDPVTYECCFSKSQPLTKAAQQILVPNFFSVAASILTYFLIGVTSSFDSIRVYCIFTNFCLAINFFGQLAFYFPCLVIHLRRVNSGRDCITFHYRTETTNSETSEKSKHHKHHHHQTNDLIIDTDKEISIQSGSNKENAKQLDTNLLVDEEDDKQINESNKTPSTSSAKTRTNKFRVGLAHYREKYRHTSVFNFLFDSKFKYILFLLFVIYFIANSIVCHAKFHTNLPITDLIPSKSFLKEHMINHMTLFNIGPIVTIAFMKPMVYWDQAVFDKIRSFLDDAKRLDGMDHLLEINWLNDTYSNGKGKEIFYDYCKDPLNYECFRETFKETVYEADFYHDDAVFTEAMAGNKSLVIKASRVYLQFQNFSGTLDEVNLVHNLKSLAHTKYNYTESDVIIFSPVFIFLEQLEELIPSMVSIFLLNFESVLFASFFVLFDLRTLIIQLIIMISLLLSIISSAVIFNLTLNIVTLYHFLLLPALICEFMFNIPYFYLYKASVMRRDQLNQQQQQAIKLKKPDATNQDDCSNEIKSIESTSNNPANLNDEIVQIEPDTNGATPHNFKEDPTQRHLASITSTTDADATTTAVAAAVAAEVAAAAAAVASTHATASLNNSMIHTFRLRQLSLAYEQCIKPTAFFVLVIIMLNFSIMYSCTTYNFQTLFLFLMSFSFNLFVHLFFFYPNLLVLFGTCWIRNATAKNTIEKNLHDLNINV